MKTGSLALIVAAILLTWSAGVTAQDVTRVDEAGCANMRLCIGVRSFARPFSYKAILPWEMASDATRGPLRRQGYTGYMIRICDAVLAEMMLDSVSNERLELSQIGYYDIDVPPSRTGSRFSDLGKRYDVLCDPATITNERRDDLMISPPLFLTGISYITPKGVPAPREPCPRLSSEPSSDVKRSLVGVVGDTTAEQRGIRALLAARELPRFQAQLIAYLGDPNNDRQCAPDEFVHVYPNHKAAADAFCKHNAFYYYVGDLEIITENVKAIPGCFYENGTQTYTNDRYAVFGKAIETKGNADLSRRLLVARFFEILAQKTVFNPSVLDKAFSDSFPDESPSRKLDLFFWSVRGERE